MPDPNPEQQNQTSQPTGPGDEASEMFSEPEDLDEPAPSNDQGPFGEPPDGEFEDDTSSSDDQQFTGDESTGSDGEPRSEENDSASDPGAEADDAATSEQSEAEAGEEDLDVEDDTEGEDTDGEDTDEPFFEGEESVYMTEDDALQGIEEKDRYINQLETKVEETNSQAQEKVQSLQSELEQRKQEVQRLRNAVDDETREELAIQDYLPEKFQDKTEADFADDEELVEFREAKLDAKAELRHERKQQQKQQEEMQNQIAQAHQDAKEFVEERIEPDEFGATSPERKAKLREFLEGKSEEQEYNRIEKAQFIVAAFGQEDGERFLSGLQAEFGGSTAASTTDDDPSNRNPEDAASDDEEDEVAEQIKKSKTSPGAPESKPRTETNEMSRREEMDHAFRRSAKEKGIRTP